MKTLARHKALLVIVLLFLAAGFLRLNDVSLYNPDSALYLIWGKSVAAGHGFMDATRPEADRYILNAPLYSVLLAPVQWFAPLSVMAAKCWTLLWGCAALTLFYSWLLRVFGKPAAIAGAVLLACNPLVLIFSTEVLSEAPFLFFFLAILLLAERLIVADSMGNSSRYALIVLILSGSIVILREAGIALILAVSAGFMFRKQYHLAAGVLAAGIIVAAVWYIRNNIIVGVPLGGRPGNITLILHHLLTRPDDSIFLELVLRAGANLSSYGVQIAGALLYPLFTGREIGLVVEPSGMYRFFLQAFESLRYGFVVPIALLMAAGIWYDLGNKGAARIRLLALLFLLAIIAVYPVYDLRFLIPFLPLMIFYFFSGVRFAVSALFRKGWNERWLIPFAVLLMAPNIVAIADVLETNAAYRSDPEGFSQNEKSVPVVFLRPFSKAGEWIANNTPSDAVIGTGLKDIALTAGGRKVVDLEPNVAEDVFEGALRDYNISYILAAVQWGRMYAYEFLMQESRRYAFSPVFSAGGLRLYKVISRLEQDVNQPDPFAAPLDTMTATGLVRVGRQEIHRGEYAGALRHFQMAGAREPDVEEPLYQIVVAAVLAGDSAAAHAAYRRLQSLPQTFGQSLLGAQMLQALDLELNAIRVPQGETAGQLLKASLIFWNNGYYGYSANLLDATLDHYQNFVPGLLWGFYYHLQLGDSAKALECLVQLRSIGAVKGAVRAITSITLEIDSLRKAATGAERARFRLAIAGQYRFLTLQDAALDEAQRALREDPGSSQAMLFIGNALETRSRYHAAACWCRRAAAAGGPDAASAASRARELDSLAMNGFSREKNND